MKQDSQKQKINLPELLAKVWASKLLMLKICSIGAVLGLVVAWSIPKEYTSKVLMTPEYTRRSASPGMDALNAMAEGGMTFATTGRDAIYPSLYPIIVKSTPFIIPFFDIKVRELKDSTVITLARYLKERQKRPWWSVITSAPSRLMGWGMSLFREKTKVAKGGSKKRDVFRLTREEAGMAGAIASRIKIGIDKKRRTITIFATMQDPLVAAAVADTVRVHLQEYVTEYRTSKARRILEYTEKLCNEAQGEYYAAQEEYTRYADANRGVAMMASRAELVRLQNEMNLALSTYNQMEQQVQAARAKVEKVTPLYAVIQPVSLPRSPSKPRKMIIITGYILLSGAGGLAWILFVKDYLRNMKRKREEESA